MKIGAVPLAEDFARIDAVKEAVGPGVSVLVDANNA
jgi:L-alanine-DL-glutamate epimerase-like enolase superfamily enzyme